jgi:hypothetical protein
VRPDFNWDKKAARDFRMNFRMRRRATPPRGGGARCEFGSRAGEVPAAARTHPWPCPAATLVGVEFDASLCSRQFIFAGVPFFSPGRAIVRDAPKVGPWSGR